MTVKKVLDLKRHAGSVYALCPWTQGSQHVLSGSSDGMVGLWDLENMEPSPFSIRVGKPVYSLCLLEEKNQILIGDGSGGLHVIDLDQKKEVRHLAIHQQPLLSIVNAGTQVLCGGMDGKYSAVNKDDFSLNHLIDFGNIKIRQIIHRNDHAFVCCSDGRLRILKLPSCELVSQPVLHQESLNTIVFHPSKNVLFSGGKDGLIKVWKTTDWTTPLLTIPAHHFALYGLTFSPDGKLLVSFSRDKTIKCWDPESLDPIIKLDRNFAGHTHSVNCGTWITNNRFVSSGDDKRLICWEFNH